MPGSGRHRARGTRIRAALLVSCTLALAVAASGQACGDCDGDGDLDVVDALKIAQIDVGIRPLPPPCGQEFNACNVQGSLCPSGMATISVLDALLVAVAAAGGAPVTCGTPVGEEVTYVASWVAASLPSTAATEIDAVPAWQLDFADGGADGLDAELDGFTLRQAPANQVPDWAVALGGALLRDAGGAPLAGGAVSTDAITFGGLALTVPDGGTLRLRIDLFTSRIPGALSGLDGDDVVLELAPRDLLTSPAGSAVAAAQMAVESGAGNLTVDVECTGIAFVSGPAAVTPVGGNMAPVALACHDAHSNVDLDFAEAVTLSRLGGAGTLTSSDPTGLTRPFVAGAASWSDLRLSTEALLRIAATSAPSGISGLSAFVAVTSSPRIDAVVPDRGPAEGGHHVQIQGLGFVSGDPVTFAGRPATDVQVLTPALLTCRVPPAAATPVDTSVDVGVGALLAPGGFMYLADTVGPALVTSIPRRAPAALADRQRFAFLFDSRVDPTSVQDPTAAATRSTALQQGATLAGSAHITEDARWIVLRRDPGTWGGPSQVTAVLFGEVVGASAVEDAHGNGILTSSMFSGRSALAFASTTPPAYSQDSTRPQVLSSVPADGAPDVLRSAVVQVVFDEAVDPTTVRLAAGGPVGGATFAIVGTAPASGWLEIGADCRTVAFHPDQPLAPGVLHEIRLSQGGAGAAIQDLAGNDLLPVVIRFTTAASPAFSVADCEPPVGDLQGGYSVRLLGEGFAPGATVTIGGAPCGIVQRRSRSELEVVVPAGMASGAVDITVTNPEGLVASAIGAFAYDASIPVDTLAPELLFEFPQASATGTTPCASESAIVLVMSEPLATSIDSIGAGPGQAIEIQGDLGLVTRSAIDPRIIVVDKATPFIGAPWIFLLPVRAAAVQRGVRDEAGNRLWPFHPDRSAGALGGEAGLGLSWAASGADVSTPSVATMRPLPGSTGNDPLATVMLALSEVFDPRSVEASFSVTDAAGTVPGEIVLEIQNMRSWSFRPARPYSGGVTVDATGVTDLSGNPIGGAPFGFTATGDTTPPLLLDLTINDIPDYLNGDLTYGGGSPIGGRLRVPPTGFTFDLKYADPGGRVSTALAEFELVCDRAVAGHPAGTNLAPLFPAGYFAADEGGATFLVPPSLPFAAGATAAGAQVSTVTCRVRDLAGNQSAGVSFTFDCVEALGTFVPLDGGTEVWHVEGFRDHEDTTYDLATYRILSPGADGCPSADGDIDLIEDMTVHGLQSFAPAFVPSGEQEVASGGGLTMNQAARNWVTNRILFHLHRLYGLSVDWSDGTSNPGFAAIRRFEPSGSSAGASISFDHASTGPGIETNRIALGGYRGPGIAGTAPFDLYNEFRDADVGETCTPTNLGVFSLVDAQAELDGTPSSAGTAYRQIYDPLTPFTGGATPHPLGSDPDDPQVCDPQADPTAFASAPRERYLLVLAALDAFAKRNAYLAAHEAAHAMGLVADGDPGGGLYGNDTAAFPGSTSAHVDLRGFYPGAGSNVMAPFAPLEVSLSRQSSFNALAFGYLLGRNLVVR